MPRTPIEEFYKSKSMLLDEIFNLRELPYDDFRLLDDLILDFVDPINLITLLFVKKNQVTITQN